MLSSGAPRASSRERASTKTDITDTRATPCTTDRTTRPRTSTRSGRVAPTYIAGAISAKTMVAATGTVLLTTFSAEKAAKK